MSGRGYYACTQCGQQSPRWLGRCPGCGAWGALVEEVARERGSRERTGAARPAVPARPLADLEGGEAPRIATGLGELDRVLGGGLVAGSVVLLGGDPGIGKSTLALQALAALASSGATTLYVSGEESPRQVRLRAERMGLGQARVLVLGETGVGRILEEWERIGPAAVVIDSIQTLQSPELESAPGSVGQVRQCAAELASRARESGAACLLIGHVTKEGFLAGPRVLEHMVDTVLYFEGDRSHAVRVLRAVKNRFGSTDELGVFEMGEVGLREVADPSAALLAERPAGAPGSAVIATVGGSRPLLVEVQALVSPTTLAQPRRTTLGIDPARVALLLAVLEKRSGLRLHDRDVFLNVVGGVRVEEPAADLGVVAAVASSARDRPLPGGLVLWGEVGLAGEVRATGRAEARRREAEKLGFARCILPAASARMLAPGGRVEIVGVGSLGELWQALFAASP